MAKDKEVLGAFRELESYVESMYDNYKKQFDSLAHIINIAAQEHELKEKQDGGL